MYFKNTLINVLTKEYLSRIILETISQQWHNYSMYL